MPVLFPPAITHQWHSTLWPEGGLSWETQHKDKRELLPMLQQEGQKVPGGAGAAQGASQELR